MSDIGKWVAFDGGNIGWIDSRFDAGSYRVTVPQEHGLHRHTLVGADPKRSDFLSSRFYGAGAFVPTPTNRLIKPRPGIKVVAVTTSWVGAKLGALYEMTDVLSGYWERRVDYVRLMWPYKGDDPNGINTDTASYYHKSINIRALTKCFRPLIHNSKGLVMGVWTAATFADADHWLKNQPEVF